MVFMTEMIKRQIRASLKVMTYPSEEVKSEELASGPEILESGGPFSIELAPFNGTIYIFF